MGAIMGAEYALGYDAAKMLAVTSDVMRICFRGDLTIPVVALTVILFPRPLVLGLDPKGLVLLTLTFLVSTVTLGTGRTHLMQGAVHLVIFAAFVVLALVP